MDSPHILAFVMAGGNGSRLQPLTTALPKPALTFGTHHCLIDFVLSNLHNSGIRAVYVLLQYKPAALLDHIARNWAGSSGAAREEFVRPLLPESTPARATFRGTAHAVHQCLHLIEQHHPDLVAVFAADHVYRMDIRPMVHFHLDNDSEATIAAVRVPLEQASSFGIIEADSRNRVQGFSEKPLNPLALPHCPGTAYASMGNYLFCTEALVHVLRAAIERGETDFGRGVFPGMLWRRRVLAYDFSHNVVPGLHACEEPAYWRDVGTVASYVAAHRDLLGAKPRLILKNEEWPIYGGSRVMETDDCKVRLRNSMFAPGTVAFNARLRNTVVQHGASVEGDVELEDCIIMKDARIGAGARLRRAIVMGPNSITRQASGYGGLPMARKSRFVSDGMLIVPPFAR